MTRVTGHPVSHVARAGVMEGGHQIHFTLRFADGQEKTFFLPVEGLGKFVMSLTQLGKLAEEERRKAGLPDAEVVTSAPLHARNFALGLSQSGDSVLVRVLTQETIPIDLEMSRKTAEALADTLHKALRQIPPTAPKPH